MMPMHAHSPDLSPERITQGLRIERVGRRVLVLPEVDSTNTYALDRLAADPDADGTVIIAEYQTAGRGRFGRAWQSPRGASLLLTMLLRETGPLRGSRTVMAASVAVAEAVEEATLLAPLIRWPNDIYLRGRKLGGILVETRAMNGNGVAVAAGIGLNCLQQRGHLPPELGETATSLEIESEQPVDRLALARAMILCLDHHFKRRNAVSDDEIAAAWHERCGDRGQRVTLSSLGQSFSGRVIDVNPSAGLLLQLDNGTRREFDLQTITRA